MSARKRCYHHGNFPSVTALHLAVGYCRLHIGTGVRRRTRLNSTVGRFAFSIRFV
jgi:hypothetical protein